MSATYRIAVDRCMCMAGQNPVACPAYISGIANCINAHRDDLSDTSAKSARQTPSCAFFGKEIKVTFEKDEL